MTIEYDPEDDTLEIWLQPEAIPEASFHSGEFSVVVGPEGELVSIVIRQARAFAEQLAAQGLPARPLGDKVWYDADSSMISAYAYDEEKQILEVAFHRTGVYRYFDVPRHVFEGLHRASSKGSYMRGAVIDMYDYEKKR
jgi:uncharacterized protein YuzE